MGTARMTNKTVFKYICLLRKIAHILKSLAPKACEINVEEPIAKQEPIEITQIEIVNDPKPAAPKREGSSACPSTAALIIKYIGWKKLPRIGEAVSLKTVFIDSLKLRAVCYDSVINPSEIYLSIKL